MKTPLTLTLLTCAAAMLGEVNAATIISWDLSNVPKLSSGATAVPISSSFSQSDYASVQSSDLNLGNLRWSTGVPSGGTLDNALNLYEWQQTSDRSKPASYVSFTLDVGANSNVTIDSLNLSNFRNHASNPPDTLTWEYSLDGTNFITIGQPSSLITPPSYGVTNVLKDQSPLTFQTGDSGTVYFRFSVTGGASTGANLHINGISMTGSITQIPEPASGVLLLGGLAAGLMLRRKAV